MAERTESELKEKLEYALQLFYDDVLEKKDLRHFFFGMDLKRIIEDYHLYKHFVMAKPELDFVKARIDAMAKAVKDETGASFTYQVGTMIELPRAALRAAEIAQSAEFFSFGTNDLTQTTLGISRDDASSFLGAYTAGGLLPADPFVTLDQDGVGELVKLAAARGRATRPSIKLGICGEHGGDPASSAFCEGAGLDYVSCSPYRVPIARLAAAQAALGSKVASQA